LGVGRWVIEELKAKIDPSRSRMERS